MKKVIYLFVLCMVLGLAGCGQSQENKEPSTESTSVQVENKNVSDIVSNEHLTNNDTANFQMPEEGYYSNDFDEILNITKEDDGTYRIEYSVTHLLYVENAIGTYDSETGILSFSGKDDRGNDIKAEIENYLKGEQKLDFALKWLIKQNFYKNSLLKYIPAKIIKWLINAIFNSNKTVIEA